MMRCGHVGPYAKDYDDDALTCQPVCEVGWWWWLLAMRPQPLMDASTQPWHACDLEVLHLQVGLRAHAIACKGRYASEDIHFNNGR